MQKLDTDRDALDSDEASARGIEARARRAGPLPHSLMAVAEPAEVRPITVMLPKPEPGQAWEVIRPDGSVTVHTEDAEIDMDPGERLELSVVRRPPGFAMLPAEERRRCEVVEEMVKYIRESSPYWAPEIRLQKLWDAVHPLKLEMQDAVLEALSKLPEDERVGCGYSLLRRVARPRGFAALPAEERRRLASMGGRAAHKSGKGHEFTTEEARAAGRKGGEKVAVNREHMAEIGRRGGNTMVERLGWEHMREIGRRGGEVTSRDRERMAEIGRKGGLARKGRAA